MVLSSAKGIAFGNSNVAQNADACKHSLVVRLVWIKKNEYSILVRFYYCFVENEDSAHRWI